MEEVFLTEPSKKYKNEFSQMVQDYHNHGEIEKFDAFNVALNDFEGYTKSLIANSKGIELPEGWVPCCTYWLVNNHKILGTIRIRKELNSELLKNIGGHIGYDIAPSERRKGYGKLILKLGLKEARLMKLSPILVTCKTDNYASAKIIEKNGGVFDSKILDKNSNEFFKRYWIN